MLPRIHSKMTMQLRSVRETTLNLGKDSIKRNKELTNESEAIILIYRSHGALGNVVCLMGRIVMTSSNANACSYTLLNPRMYDCKYIPSLWTSWVDKVIESRLNWWWVCGHHSQDSFPNEYNHLSFDPLSLYSINPDIIRKGGENLHEKRKIWGKISIWV